MYDLKDKVVVITGAAKGIGAAVVLELLEEGVQHVRVLDVDEAAGLTQQNELNEKYGDNKVKFAKCDVTNDEEFYQALEDAKEDNGFIDLVINNAGVAEESSVARVRKLLEINVIALVNGTIKAIELMRTDKGGRGGAVLNISSIAGLLPICTPLFGYSTSKAAVLQFSTCIGQEHCANTGVRVMAVCYGVTDTPILGTMNSLRKEYTPKVQEIVATCPIQTVESAARGTIEVLQKGETATTWLIHNNEPARDITAVTRQNDEAILRILQGLE